MDTGIQALSVHYTIREKVQVRNFRIPPALHAKKTLQQVSTEVLNTMTFRKGGFRHRLTLKKGRQTDNLILRKLLGHRIRELKYTLLVGVQLQI